MIICLGLIFIATLLWSGLKLEWLHDFFDLLLYVSALFIIAWNYKTKAKWAYSEGDLKVIFSFNLFGYQQVAIKTKDSTLKKKFQSYKPQSFLFKNGVFVEFNRLNQEVGGFGLHLTQNGKELIPDHIIKS